MADLKSYKAPMPSRDSKVNGPRLLLEPYDRSAHLQALWTALGGADGINQKLKYFPNDDFTGPNDLGDWLESVNASQQYFTYIALNHQRDVLGMASYMRIDTKNGVIEVGAVAHGSGMARSPASTELHYLMARHAFQDMGYRRYEWKCHNANEPSKKAALRYGFTFEGVFRQHMVSKGENRDTAWFSIIDKEWPVVRAALEEWLLPTNFDGSGSQIRRLEEIRATIGAASNEE